MVLSQKLVLGLVLSLSSSCSLLLSAHAATATVKAVATSTSTTTAPPAPTGTPDVFLGVASAYTSNTIYYQGGQVNSANVSYSNQLFSLDLRKSWPNSSPPWVNLTAPSSGSLTGPSVSEHSATVSKDGSTLLFTAPTGKSGPFLYQYNIAAGSWSTVNAPTAQASSWTNRKDAQFVTDPNTGNAWLLGGAFSDGSSTNEIDMWDGEQWNPNQPITPAAGSSSAVLNNFSSGTAQLYNNKVYIFGGFSSTSGQRGYQSFQSIPWIDISTTPPTYGTQLTLGAIPAARQDHCSVLTASHKVIIYGGFDANAKSTFSDIWSLDLVTMTWSQIVPANPTSPRYRHNCAIAGANMVVYGGAATSATGPQTGYARDVQIYDVMLTSWMSSYTPKQDTTPISQPLGGGGPSNGGGLGVGPIVGIVVGVLVVAGCVLGFLYYKRRQKRIEIHEAELEKAAYLASLRPEGGDRQGKDGYMGTSVVSTPGMSHSGAYNGMDELLLNNGGGSPGMGGQGQNNVQYLMQHLPDGTIAVQPVYLDHQSVQTPNMRGATADDNAYVSPVMSNNSNGGGSSGGYFAPPPPSSNTSAQIHVASALTSPYVLPPQQKPHVTYPQPSHDPFASPSMATTPLPPGYNPQSHSHSATLGLGSPQQMPDRLQ